MSNNAILTVYKDIIAKNYQTIKKEVGNTPVAVMLKANAYGCGIINIFTILHNQGVKDFFVANLSEALQVKEAVSQQDVNIYVLHDISEGNYQQFLDNNFIPVLNTVANIKLWAEKGIQKNSTPPLGGSQIRTTDLVGGKTEDNKQKDTPHSIVADSANPDSWTLPQGASKKEESLKKHLPAPCIIHFDSGLNRLGISYEEALELKTSGAFKKLNLAYVISHFSSSSNPDTSYAEFQYKKFESVMPLFPEGTKFSIANSGAIFQNKKYHMDMVRTGSALYGINPTCSATNPLKNAIEIQAQIIQIKPVKIGNKIGYNQTHTMEHNGKIAVIAAGYADSILRSHANKGCFYYGDKKLPIIGAVSMDLTTIDITYLNEELNEGDFVEVLGEHQDLDAFGASGGTSGYEILTSLSKRYIWEFK